MSIQGTVNSMISGASSINQGIYNKRLAEVKFETALANMKNAKKMKKQVKNSAQAKRNKMKGSNTNGGKTT